MSKVQSRTPVDPQPSEKYIQLQAEKRLDLCCWCVFLLMYNRTQVMATEQASVRLLPQIALKIRKKQLGNIDQLELGDAVLFTDMDGVTNGYEVVAVDILAPSAVEEMTSGAFDLTLFTCTYGGQNRVTVYCERFNGE